MPDFSRYLLFMAAALSLLVTPGPAVLYVVTRSIDQGRRAGVISALGVQLGSLVHVTAAAFGLSALLASSAIAFNSVKYVGAAYLVFLGVKKFLKSEDPSETRRSTPPDLWHVFSQGVLVNVLNPKTALFFFAFLPQFVDPTRGHVAAQIFFLGMTFVVMGICSDSSYALLAGTFGNGLKRNTRFLRRQRYFAGTVYMGLGFATALSGSRRSH